MSRSDSRVFSPRRSRRGNPGDLFRGASVRLAACGCGRWGAMLWFFGLGSGVGAGGLAVTGSPVALLSRRPSGWG